MKVSKVEEKLDKLFDNYLDIYTTMVDQGKQLEIQNEHLKEHMRRTALLEEKVGLKHILKLGTSIGASLGVVVGLVIKVLQLVNL